MSDVSILKVEGVGYNVKDATARTAASDAQTTANSKLSDAPSDGKEYARKNGAWAEVSGGGSGLPEGGKIGQVLAKNSDEDGDAGWYKINDLPSDKWYLVDGIMESNVIAAYQFVDRASEAEALINVNEGTEYALAKSASSITWSSAKGFFMPGVSNVYLNNSTLVNNYSNVFSAAFGYSGSSIDTGITSGIRLQEFRTLEIKTLVGDATTNSKPGFGSNNNGHYYAPNNSPQYGVLSCNFAEPVSLYINGNNQSLTSGGTFYRGNRSVFGTINTSWNTYKSCYITALVFYNISLTSAQHLQLSNNITALGGI